MSIRLQCPGCRKQLSLPDEAAGKTGACPVCKTVFQANVAEEPPMQVTAVRESAPKRRTAPSPVLDEDETPSGGLSKNQKLALAGGGVGVLAVGVVVAIFALKGSDSTPDDNRQAKANLPPKTPLRQDSPVKTKDSGTFDSKAPARNSAAEKRDYDSFFPEEDVGAAAVPSTSTPKRPADSTGRSRTIETDEALPKSKQRPPAEREPRSTEIAPDREPRSADPTPAETRSTTPVEAVRMSGPQIYERLLKSTVMVVRKDKSGGVARGSGSLVDREQRLVLTNYHMVHGSDEVYVSFPVNEGGKPLSSKAYLQRFLDSKFTPAKVVRVRKGQDLALVQLDDLPAGIPAVKLAPRSARQGEAVHSIGNPGTSDASFVYAPGAVRSVSHKTWKAGGDDFILSLDADILETNSPTNHGDSGGPLVNDFMQLVGITQGGGRKERDMSFFIDQSEIRRLFKDQGIEEGASGDTDVVRTGSAVPEEIAKDLSSSNARTRAQAAARLADMGPDAKSVLQQLIHALEDSDRNVRKQVGNAITQTGWRGDIQRNDLGSLRACLRDETASGEMQRWAMKAVALLGENGKAAVADVTALVKSDDKETRYAAVVALERLGPVQPTVLADAASGLKTEDRRYNVRFATALVKLDPDLKTKEGKAAVDVLIAFQKPLGTEEDRNSEVVTLVKEAEKALSHLGKPAVPQIRKAMMSTYRGGVTIEETVNRGAVRLAMIRVLEGMADKAVDALGDLRILEGNDPVLPVRDAAREARSKIRP
jgi:S1-C subfamily serine protease